MVNAGPVTVESTHYPPTRREIERPAGAFDVGAFGALWCGNRRAAEIGRHQHAVFHVERAPGIGDVKRGIDRAGIAKPHKRARIEERGLEDFASERERKRWACHPISAFRPGP